MKKLILSALFAIVLTNLYAQTINLKTNGYSLNFKSIDTLFYAEYSNNGTMKRNSNKEDFYSVNLKYNFGKLSKTQAKNTIETPVFTSNYYVYTDGTLQAPTTLGNLNFLYIH